MKRNSETLGQIKQYFKKDQGLFDWKVARSGEILFKEQGRFAKHTLSLGGRFYYPKLIRQIATTTLKKYL